MPPTETPEARRLALAVNAVGAALRPYSEYLRLSIRENIARSVVAALDDDARAEAQRSSAEPGHIVLHIGSTGADRQFRALLRDVVKADNRPAADRPCRHNSAGTMRGCWTCSPENRVEVPPVREPFPLQQLSTGWEWRCHLCPHGQDGYWTRWGALRGQNRHYTTHGADHA